MRSFLLGLLMLLTLFLGFWAYQQNYKTRAALKETRNIERQIRIAGERMNMLKAEWNYLNRPDRLKELVDINFLRVKLQPMQPSQIKSLAEITEYGGL